MSEMAANNPQLHNAETLNSAVNVAVSDAGFTKNGIYYFENAEARYGRLQLTEGKIKYFELSWDSGLTADGVDLKMITSLSRQPDNSFDVTKTVVRSVLGPAVPGDARSYDIQTNYHGELTIDILKELEVRLNKAKSSHDLYKDNKERRAQIVKNLGVMVNRHVIQPVKDTKEPTKVFILDAMTRLGEAVTALNFSFPLQPFGNKKTDVEESKSGKI